MTTHKETIQGDTPLKIALRRHDQDLIRFLITLGANPSARDRNGDTPLHFAVLQDCEVAMLLDAGADVNAQTTALGETPLHLALRENRTNIAQLLIHRGTNLHATDYDRQTPLDVARDDKMRRLIRQRMSENYISIPTATCLPNPSGKGHYTAFSIHLLDDFCIAKRYSEFARLHKELKAQYQSHEFPVLPPKKMNGRFGLGLNSLQIEQRRKALEAYLQQICAVDSLRACEQLSRFLGPSSRLRLTFNATVQQRRSIVTPETTHQKSILFDAQSRPQQGLLVPSAPPAVTIVERQKTLDRTAPDTIVSCGSCGNIHPSEPRLAKGLSRQYSRAHGSPLLKGLKVQMSQFSDSKTTLQTSPLSGIFSPKSVNMLISCRRWGALYRTRDSTSSRNFAL
eukprot:m.214097 g.214097  ORF g.214097 m.214097 type:complete len:397 (-) comp16961_c0_seq21:794-1984(-)